MSAVEDYKSQRGTAHNYCTQALTDAAIAELEADLASANERFASLARRVTAFLAGDTFARERLLDGIQTDLQRGGLA